MKLDNCKILVCCHKACELPENEMCLPIQAGAAISDTDLGILRDDQLDGVSCDNISSKNKSFCELTVLYWAWKNLAKLFPDIAFVGLSHYRRLFPELQKKHIKFLKRGGVIVPEYVYYPCSVEDAYKIAHVSFDIEILRKAVVTLYPDYKQALLKVFRGNKTTVFNMFIAPKKIFDAYCEWLFPILFEIEKNVVIDYYPEYQKRIFGFMSERLLYVYLIKNNIRLQSIKIKTVGISSISLLHGIFNRIRFGIGFFFGKRMRY